MKTKTDKINNEIAKTREKITDLQTKLRELERNKTEQENSEIIEIIRRVDVEPRELAAFIEAYRQQGAQAAIEAAGGSAVTDTAGTAPVYDKYAVDDDSADDGDSTDDDTGEDE